MKYFLALCAVLLTVSIPSLSAADTVKAATGKTDAGKAQTPKSIPKPVEPKLGPAKVPSKLGEWATTITTTMDNGASAEGSSLFCVLPKDLRMPETLVPTYSEVGMSCANKSFKLTGSTATWLVSCTGQRGATIEGKGTLIFAGDTQRGSSKLTKVSGGKTINMEQKISAKLLGACKN